MYFTVTIDTEEDNWGEYQRPSYSVENVRRVPVLQEIFERRGVRPTYLVSHPVATAAMASDTLNQYRERDACEIGSHPHPWNTPPVEEERTPFNSFISHLSPDLQFRKIKTLHDAIARSFGRPPTSYRSGRWGFSEDVARNLLHLGYTVDSSVSAATDWSEYGGPDYSDAGHEPYAFVTDNVGMRLLEVPATAATVQGPPRQANMLYWAIRRRIPGGGRILSALRRTHLLNHVSLSPELHSAPDMVSLLRQLERRGAKVANMFFHSPSLLEGCSPFVRTRGQADDFVERIDRVLAYAQAAGLKAVTMSELPHTDVAECPTRRL